MVITFNQMPTQITINSITGLPPFNIYISDNILNPAIYVTTITSAPYTFNVPIILENSPEYILKIVDSNGCIIYYTPPLTINYLVEQCCPSTLYWTLPDDTLTDLSEALPTGDCEDFDGSSRTLKDELIDCYCNVLSDTCFTDKYSYEIQPCGRKTIKFDAGGGVYWWFVQNLDYTFSVYYIEESITPGSYTIIKDTNCCSESYMSGYTNSGLFSSDCGSFTGSGLFDWYNRTVLEFDLSEDYLFYPYYDLETDQCMVSGGTIEEVVTISEIYPVLNKVIKSDEGICYEVKSIVTSASTITWVPPTIYEDCSDCDGYKQFQDFELFEFMDNIRYNFQQ